MRFHLTPTMSRETLFWSPAPHEYVYSGARRALPRPLLFSLATDSPHKRETRWRRQVRVLGPLPRRQRQLWIGGVGGAAVTRWRQPRLGPRARPLAPRCWCCRRRCCSRRHRRGQRSRTALGAWRPRGKRRPCRAATRCAEAAPNAPPTRRARVARAAAPAARAGPAVGPATTGSPTRRCWASAPAAAHPSAAARVVTGARPPRGPGPSRRRAARQRSQVEFPLLPLGSGARLPRPGLAWLGGGGSQALALLERVSRVLVGLEPGFAQVQYVFLNFELRDEVRARWIWSQKFEGSHSISWNKLGPGWNWWVEEGTELCRGSGGSEKCLI